jgi:radical SAM protein with 4Fe4S-binding SPASM domain
MIEKFRATNLNKGIIFIKEFDKEKSLLCIPEFNEIALVNKKIFPLLSNFKLITEISQKTSTFPIKSSFNPTSVVIIPTYNCNLCCRYCYAKSNSGKDKSTNMPISEIKRILDYLASNSEKFRRPIRVLFLGGGEPTLHWKAITYTVNYLKKLKRNKKIFGSYLINLVSNGTFNREQAIFIARNFNEIQISIDGIKKVQNYNRPSKELKGSFDIVFNNLKLLDKLKANYYLYIVLNELSARYLEESIKFFYKELKYLKRIKLGFLLPVGRAEDSTMEERDFHSYLYNIGKAISKYYDKIARSFFDDYVNWWKPIKSNCFTFYNSSAYFMPSGNIINCIKIDKQKERDNLYFLGRYSFRSRKFYFTSQAGKLLYNLNTILPFCKNCSLNSFCLGGCPPNSRDRIKQKQHLNRNALNECSLNRFLHHLGILILLREYPDIRNHKNQFHIKIGNNIISRLSKYYANYFDQHISVKDEFIKIKSFPLCQSPQINKYIYKIIKLKN